MGHARALLALDGARQVEAANRSAARGLSVRETEALAQRWIKSDATPAKRKKVDRDIARLEEETAEKIGTTVEIRAGRKGTGKLILHYASYEHLDELIAKLGQR